MTINKVLVVGYGSIGKRHLRIAREHLPDADIRVLTRVAPLHIEPYLSGYFTDMQDALAFQPDVAVIANPATHHITSALALAAIGTHLLIEKPLATTEIAEDDFKQLSSYNNLVVLIGYNLRHLPSLGGFRQHILDGLVGDVHSVRCEVGQNLAVWRQDIDYRQSVSASKELGGGVLLELSHELDYLTWIFGDATWVQAWLGRQSNLDIDVEDSAHLLIGLSAQAEAKDLVASVTLDFIRHDLTRTCTVIGDRGSLRWDGIAHQVSYFAKGASDWQVLYDQKAGRDESYVNQWRYFVECIEHAKQARPALQDGQRILRLIDSAREAALFQRVIIIQH